MRSSTIRLRLQVRRMVAWIVFSVKRWQNVHMFTRKLKIWRTPDSTSEELTSFAAWQKILVAVMVMGVMGYLFWSRCKYLETKDDEIRKKKTVIQVVTERKTCTTQLDIQGALGNSFGQRTTSDYCQSKDCKTISCSSIFDPGRVVSKFIETEFKVDCKHTKSVKLSFSRCKFPGNALQRNWLSTNLSVEELTFDSCSLSEIEDDVFFLTIYERTQKIYLVSNKLSFLRRAMFRHLDSLTELAIRENTIKKAEYNLLENVASTLTSLELSNAIDDTGVLGNITGGNKSLEVQILTLRRNSIPRISSELFKGVPAVKSLYLEDSKVKTVSRSILNPMASSILQLMINDNSIQSLPEGVFNPILHIERPFRMSIHNNPWRCDCNLKWLQDLVQTHQSKVISIPFCSTPEINTGKSFAKADFCPSSSTVTDIVSIEFTSQTTSHSSGITEGDAGLTCSVARSLLQSRGSRKLLSTDFNFPSHFPGFSLSKLPDEGILVNLPDLDEGMTLLWFDNGDVNRTLSCAKNIKHSYLMRNIDRQATYTICLLSDNQTTVSPLNCLAVTTDPDYQYRTWLRNADKTVVFSLIIASYILLFLMGAFLTFVLIRRHPSLLRGSKRVMLVKRRNVDAIVLPKGVSVQEQGQGCRKQEDGYITPLPPAPVLVPRTRRVSRVSSMQSDWNSYVSDLEPTETQLSSWKLYKLNNDMEKGKSEAPPLPPHHPHGVPSLSLAVESRAEYYADQAFNF